MTVHCRQYFRSRRSDLNSNQNIRIIKRIGRAGDHGSANIHEGVKEASQGSARTFKGNDEGRAVQMLISEVKKSDNAEQSICVSGTVW